MSDLASNNPFRDRVEPPPYQVAAASNNTGRNPFLDITSNTAQRSSHDRSQSERRRVGPERHEPATRIPPESSQRTREDKSKMSDRERDSARHRSQKASDSSASRRHKIRSNSDSSATLQSKDRYPPEKRKDRSTKEGNSASSSKPRKHLDKIDRLDVTGFSAIGGFHHDGPFDACNPNRNKNSKKAPVLAFAKDSTAMTMAAGPPSQPVYFGDHVNNTESFSDYGNAAQKTRPTVGVRTASFDPASIVDPIHGYESVGLGTTTFLEGAPASRSAMLARTVSDNGSRNELRPRATSDHATGLGRKKSVLQKIRGAYRDRSSESPADHTPSPPSSPHKHHKDGADYFTDNKETTADMTTKSFELVEETGSPSHLSPLYRPASNNNSAGVGPSAANGLIKRVKSLRVGGKKRSE